MPKKIRKPVFRKIVLPLPDLDRPQIMFDYSDPPCPASFLALQCADPQRSIRQASCSMI